MKTSEKMLEVIKRTREKNDPFSQTNTISNKSLETVHAKKVAYKAKCFWLGFLRGLLASENITQDELEPLVMHTRELLSHFPDDDAYELLTEISMDWDDLLAEAEGLVENILEFREGEAELEEGYNAKNYFHGFLKGIACDNLITFSELNFAATFLTENPKLLKDPRVSVINDQIDLILADGEVDAEESDEICSWISRLVGDSFADTSLTAMTDQGGSEDYLKTLDINSIVNVDAVVTGVFNQKRSRRQIVTELKNLGVEIKQGVSKKTDFLIVADEASKYWATPNAGTKLLKAHDLKQETGKPNLVSEHLINQMLDNAIS